MYSDTSRGKEGRSLKLYQTVGRRQSPRQHVAELRYKSVRRHRTSDPDTLPFPRLPRSGGAHQYQNVRCPNMPYDVTSRKGVTVLQLIPDCTAARK